MSVKKVYFLNLIKIAFNFQAVNISGILKRKIHGRLKG